MLGVGGIGLFSSLGKDEILSPCLCGGLSVQGRNSNKEIKSDMFETAGRGLSLYVPGLTSSGPGFFRCLLISTWQMLWLSQRTISRWLWLFQDPNTTRDRQI